MRFQSNRLFGVIFLLTSSLAIAKPPYDVRLEKAYARESE
jgi:hypothetical protein